MLKQISAMGSNFIHRMNLTTAVWIIAGIAFFIQILIGSHFTGHDYEYITDELYFMALSHHPAWGYVDVPPLVPWILILTRLTTNNALWAIHIVSSLMYAGTILLTARMARLLGGSAWAQTLAALAAATAFQLVISGSVCDYNVFDVFWWSLTANILIILLRDNSPKRWVPFGITAGLGLLTKSTMLFWGFALISGILLTPQRHLLFNRFLWIGGSIALALVSPFILWNTTHGFPTIEFFSNYSAFHTNASTSPFGFFLTETLMMNPFLAPLWGAGLWYVFSEKEKSYRVFGYAYMILFILFVLLHVQFYFLSPACLPLYAFGALQFDDWIAQRVWLKRACVVLPMACTILFIPTLMPVPIFQPDKLDWRSLTQHIAIVYYSLPKEDQHGVCIMTPSAGLAAALYQFDDQYGLPLPISGHNTFYFWGYQRCTGQIVILVGGTERGAKALKWYDSITLADIFSCNDCQIGKLPIFILRQPQIPFDQIWAKERIFN